VREGSDFLLFSEVFLLEGLDLGLEFLGKGGGFVGFDAKRTHFLWKAMGSVQVMTIGS